MIKLILHFCHIANHCSSFLISPKNDGPKSRNLKQFCPTTSHVWLPWRVPIQLNSVYGSAITPQKCVFERLYPVPPLLLSSFFLIYSYRLFSFHPPIQQYGKCAHLCVGDKQRREGDKGSKEIWDKLGIQESVRERFKAFWNHFPRFHTAYYT